MVVMIVKLHKMNLECNPRETIIKKLIDDVLNDTSRAKIDFKILPNAKDQQVLVAERVRLPKHLTIEDVD